MKKFLDNMVSISLYGLMFCLLITIGGWKMETREIIAICLILGFFAGLINNIERVLRELFDKKGK